MLSSGCESRAHAFKGACSGIRLSLIIDSFSLCVITEMQGMRVEEHKFMCFNNNKSISRVENIHFHLFCIVLS